MITLAKTCTAFGEIAILQSRLKGSRINYQEDWFRGEADRSGVSLAGYAHAIFGLIAQTIAREVLMIGCGGGTLGTMLSRAGRLVTVVDINPHSIAPAQQYFYLPKDVTCCVEDGASFLKQYPKRFDAIVIDAFSGDRLPPQLCSPEFFQLARQDLLLQDASSSTSSFIMALTLTPMPSRAAWRTLGSRSVSSSHQG